MKRRIIRILGTRGIPAAHGGFETFAEHLALYLAERDWRVTVYCQEHGTEPVTEDQWRAVRRVHIPISTQGAAGTVVFDWRSIWHALQETGLVLTLGYNTAIFSTLYRVKGLRNIINMDGVEWRRQKWGRLAKTWFWLNDWAGCWLAHHLVADHPEIKRHLSSRVPMDKISMIPYGADRVETADPLLLAPYRVEPNSFAILIARAEPENSILEVVSAWSKQQRNCRLLVLGRYEGGHAYQRAVRAAASDQVIFPGAIYEKAVVQALRFHARFYIHGHQVGGTNPSLVEALGAGNAILAHDNPYNRWVARDAGVYFHNESDCADRISDLLACDRVRSSPIDPPARLNGGEGLSLLARLSAASRARHAEAFTWEAVLGAYERMLLEHA